MIMNIIDSVLNFLKEFGFFEVSVATALLLIPTVAVHILEERLKDFHRFFNMDWFGSVTATLTRLEPASYSIGIIS